MLLLVVGRLVFGDGGCKDFRSADAYESNLGDGVYRGVVVVEFALVVCKGFGDGGMYPSFWMIGIRVLFSHLMHFSRDFLLVIMVRSILFSLYLMS